MRLLGFLPEPLGRSLVQLITQPSVLVKNCKKQKILLEVSLINIHHHHHTINRNTQGCEGCIKQLQEGISGEGTGSRLALVQVSGFRGLGSVFVA
jgi:hypothetical protein